jgi:DNA replication licensing factor MCM4
MDLIVNDIFSELFPEVNTAESPIQIRPFNIGKTVNVRLLDPSGITHILCIDIDQLVAIRGIVVRVSNIVPDMRLGI